MVLSHCLSCPEHLKEKNYRKEYRVRLCPEINETEVKTKEHEGKGKDRLHGHTRNKKLLIL
uniref:Uncharacterized protein n=1 Tax=Rhizophora mucronata TaxID=61149 RepID=A0A2P2JH10_RHIMU